MTKAELIYHKIKNDKPNLGMSVNTSATLEAIENLETLVGQKLPRDIKDFYSLTNGFETSDFLFRILPIEEIIEYKKELKTNELYLAEYMIYSDTWDIILDNNSNSEYRIVNYNHKTERQITLTTSIFEFIERYIDGDGLFGEHGLYKWYDAEANKNNT